MLCHSPQRVMNLLCEPGEDEVSIRGKLNNQRPSPTMPFLWENPFFFSPGYYSILFIQKPPSPYLPVFILPVLPFPCLGRIGQCPFYSSAGVSTSHDNSSTLGCKTLCLPSRRRGHHIDNASTVSTVPWEEEDKKDPVVFPKWKQATEDRETVVSLYLAKKPESEARGLHSHVPSWMGRERTELHFWHDLLSFHLFGLQSLPPLSWLQVPWKQGLAGHQPSISIMATIPTSYWQGSNCHGWVQAPMRDIDAPPSSFIAGHRFWEFI